MGSHMSNNKEKKKPKDPIKEKRKGKKRPPGGPQRIPPGEGEHPKNR